MIDTKSDRPAKYSILRLELQKRRALRAGRALRWSTLLSRFLRYIPLPPEWRIQFDAVERPHLAYGMFVAAMQAKAIGLSGITCIEFGVASGGGLRAMEKYVDLIRSIPEFSQFGFDVVGFDRAVGLPETLDVRDLAYWFEPGIFEVDASEVRRSLRFARYIVGDVKDTLKELGDVSRNPIGFVSFDLDHYTSTKDALQVFDLPSSSRLPRVICYLDDIIGISDLTFMGVCVGEEAAIREWTDNHPHLPLAKMSHLRDKRPLSLHYNEKYYCLHDMQHPLYNTPLNPLK